MNLRATLTAAVIIAAAGAQASVVRGLGARNLQVEGTLTPTSVPTGTMFITVTTLEPQINVRAGPSSAIYPIVGFLLRGATAPALGRSAGGDWIQIEMAGAPNGKGWVYSPLVTLSPGALPIAEPPPTPVPPPTATIDPTLAAQFNTIPTVTRLPTFTPAPRLHFPKFTPEQAKGGGLPVALGGFILFLGGLGVAGLLVSVIARR